MLRTIFSLIAAILILSLVYLFYPVLVVTGKPLMILNMWDEKELPEKFRTSSDPLREEKGIHPSTLGLKELQASGSAQFSEMGLQAILEKLPTKEITVIDLREESHGFLNGMAISWFIARNWINKGRSINEILMDEEKRLNQIMQYPFAIIYVHKKFPLPIFVKQTQTEETLVSNLGLGYLRLPVTDHLRPSDSTVDTFIHFIKSLPKNSLWLHFHCAGGIGRTSSFLTMYDMMRNATQVKLQDILQRQYLLGGVDYLNITTNDWRKNYIEERKVFLKQFYLYCQQNPLFQKSWSSWVIEQKEKTKATVN